MHKVRKQLFSLLVKVIEFSRSSIEPGAEGSWLPLYNWYKDLKYA